MRFDRDRFYAAYRAAFPGRLIDRDHIGGMNFLLSFFESDTALADIRHVAYMLATVKHECADTWQPIVERGQRSYFDKYEYRTSIGKRLGNIYDGDGYVYRGRGYVQITGRANYHRLSQALDIGDELVQYPERALLPEIAYQIMSIGMRRGLFTGKKLIDYINDSECDYTQARRIINGTDRASLIASYAQSFETILRTSITGEC